MKCGSCGHEVTRYRCFRDNKDGSQLNVCHPCLHNARSTGPVIIIRNRTTGDAWHLHINLIFIGREKAHPDVNVPSPVGVQ